MCEVKITKLGGRTDTITVDAGDDIHEILNERGYLEGDLLPYSNGTLIEDGETVEGDMNISLLVSNKGG